MINPATPPFWSSTRRIIASALVACMVIDSVQEAAFAAQGGFTLAPTVANVSSLSFFSRQALNARLSDFLHAAPAISIGHLVETQLPAENRLSRSASARITSVMQPVHPSLPWLTWFDGAALVILGATSVAGWLFQGSESPINFACGNDIVYGALGLLVMVKKMRGGASYLFNRGVLSFGASFFVEEQGVVPAASQVPGFEEKAKISYWKFEVIKDVILKRDDPVEVAFSQLEKKITASIKKFGGAVTNMVALHSRFGTTGRKNTDTIQDLVNQAQPGIAPGTWELRWDPAYPDSTNLKPHYVWVEHHDQINGDHEATEQLQLADDDKSAINNQELRDRLSRWLDGVPAGDAPLRALLMKMFYTERMWLPSIRYALFAHVSQPGDQWDKNPPREAMKSWALFFNHAFAVFKESHPEDALMGPSDIESSDGAAKEQKRLALQATEFANFLLALLAAPDASQKRREFIETVKMRSGNREIVTNAMMNDMRDQLGDSLETLIRAATTAFWRNTFQYASIREIKPRTHGLIGGTFTSTLNPPGSRVMNITDSSGQSIVMTFNKKGDLGSITSDRGIQQQFPQESPDDDQFALILNDKNNESVVSGMGPDKKLRFTLYIGPESIPATEAQIRARLRPLKLLGDPEVYAEAKGLVPLSRSQSGLRKASMGLGGVMRGWEDVAQGVSNQNRQAMIEIFRLFMQQRIYEYIRKRIGVNERRLSPALEESLWERSDALSRAMWARTMNESELTQASEQIARGAEKTIIAEAPIRGRLEMIPNVLGEMFRRIEKGLRGSSEDQVNALRSVAASAVGTLDLGAHGGRLEEGNYDFIVVGTEKSELAGEKWALYQLAPLLGLRGRVISGNDYEEIADRYKDDPEGFRRELGINSMRSAIFIGSESAETSDSGINTGWSLVTVRELFTITGNRDNRLIDGVKKTRAIHFYTNGARDEDNVAAYVQAIQTYNEASLFALTEMTSRFTTGGSDWHNGLFFQTPFSAGDVPILRRSNSRFISDVVPSLLGYNASGDEVLSKDVEKLDNLANHLGVRQLEMTRLWMLEKAYIILAPFIGSGVGVSLMYSGIFSHIATWPVEIVLSVTSGIVSMILPVSLMIGVRYIRKKLGWATPDIFAGFGPPSFVFTDKYRYVYEFLTLRARLAFGRAFGINGASFFESSINDLIHKFKAAANRRVVVLIGRPGIYHPALEAKDRSADMDGRQLMSLVNLPIPIPLFRTGWVRWILDRLKVKPVGPEVILWGHHEAKTDDWTLQGRDRDVSVATNNILFNSSNRPIPDYLAHYWEDNYGGFGRLLAALRFQAVWAEKVANHKPSFEPFRVHANVGVTSTPSPVSGGALIERIQRMPQQTVEIVPEGGWPAYEVDAPITLLSHPMDALWPSELQLHARGHEPDLQPPTRLATTTPATPTIIATPLAPPVTTGRRRKISNGTVPAVTLPPVALVEPSAVKPAPKNHDDPFEADALRMLLTPVGSSENSVVLKTLVSDPYAGLEGTLILFADGKLESKVEIPEALLEVIRGALTSTDLVTALAASTDQRPLYITIKTISNRAAFYKPAKSSAEISRGVVVLDTVLVSDLMNDTEAKTGAANAIRLELIDEFKHVTKGSLAKQGDTPLHNVSAEQLEFYIQSLKILRFLDLSSKARQQVIDFWKNHPQFGSTSSRYVAILQEANAAFAKALGKDRSTEKKSAARTQASAAIRDSLESYVEDVATQPAPEIVIEQTTVNTISSPPGDSGKPWKVEEPVEIVSTPNTVVGRIKIVYGKVAPKFAGLFRWLMPETSGTPTVTPKKHLAILVFGSLLPPVALGLVLLMMGLLSSPSVGVSAKVNLQKRAVVIPADRAPPTETAAPPTSADKPSAMPTPEVEPVNPATPAQPKEEKTLDASKTLPQSLQPPLPPQPTVAPPKPEPSQPLIIEEETKVSPSGSSVGDMRKRLISIISPDFIKNVHAAVMATSVPEGDQLTQNALSRQERIANQIEQIRSVLQLLVVNGSSLGVMQRSQVQAAIDALTKDSAVLPTETGLLQNIKAGSWIQTSQVNQVIELAKQLLNQSKFQATSRGIMQGATKLLLFLPVALLPFLPNSLSAMVTKEVASQVVDTASSMQTIDTVGSYVLQANDSPWKVAHQFLKSGRLYEHIQRMNPTAHWNMSDRVNVPTTIQVHTPGQISHDIVQALPDLTTMQRLQLILQDFGHQVVQTITHPSPTAILLGVGGVAIAGLAFFMIRRSRQTAPSETLSDSTVEETQTRTGTISPRRSFFQNPLLATLALELSLFGVIQQGFAQNAPEPSPTAVPALTLKGIIDQNALRTKKLNDATHAVQGAQSKVDTQGPISVDVGGNGIWETSGVHGAGPSVTLTVPVAHDPTAKHTARAGKLADSRQEEVEQQQADQDKVTMLKTAIAYVQSATEAAAFGDMIAKLDAMLAKKPGDADATDKRVILNAERASALTRAVQSYNLLREKARLTGNQAVITKEDLTPQSLEAMLQSTGHADPAAMLKGLDVADALEKIYGLSEVNLRSWFSKIMPQKLALGFNPNLTDPSHLLGNIGWIGSFGPLWDGGSTFPGHYDKLDWKAATESMEEAIASVNTTRAQTAQTILDALAKRADDVKMAASAHDIAERHVKAGIAAGGNASHLEKAAEATQEAAAYEADAELQSLIILSLHVSADQLASWDKLASDAAATEVQKHVESLYVQGLAPLKTLRDNLREFLKRHARGKQQLAATKFLQRVDALLDQAAKPMPNPISAGGSKGFGLVWDVLNAGATNSHIPSAAPYAANVKSNAGTPQLGGHMVAHFGQGGKNKLGKKVDDQQAKVDAASAALDTNKTFLQQTIARQSDALFLKQMTTAIETGIAALGQANPAEDQSKSIERAELQHELAKLQTRLSDAVAAAGDSKAVLPEDLSKLPAEFKADAVWNLLDAQFQSAILQDGLSDKQVHDLNTAFWDQWSTSGNPLIGYHAISPSAKDLIRLLAGSLHFGHHSKGPGAATIRFLLQAEDTMRLIRAETAGSSEQINLAQLIVDARRDALTVAQQNTSPEGVAAAATALSNYQDAQRQLRSATLAAQAAQAISDDLAARFKAHADHLLATAWAKAEKPSDKPALVHLAELNLADKKGQKTYLAGWDAPGGPFYSITTVLDQSPEPNMFPQNWGGQGGFSFTFDNRKAGQKAKADSISDAQDKLDQAKATASQAADDVAALRAFALGLEEAEKSIGTNTSPEAAALLAAARRQAWQDIAARANAGGVSVAAVKPMDLQKATLAVRFKSPAAAARAIPVSSVQEAKALGLTGRSLTALGFLQRAKSRGIQIFGNFYHWNPLPGRGLSKKELKKEKALLLAQLKDDLVALRLAQVQSLDASSRAHQDELEAATKAIAQSKDRWATLVKESRDGDDPEWSDVMHHWILAQWSYVKSLQAINNDTEQHQTLVSGAVNKSAAELALVDVPLPTAPTAELTRVPLPGPNSTAARVRQVGRDVVGNDNDPELRAKIRTTFMNGPGKLLNQEQLSALIKVAPIASFEDTVPTPQGRLDAFMRQQARISRFVVEFQDFAGKTVTPDQALLLAVTDPDMITTIKNVFPRIHTLYNTTASRWEKLGLISKTEFPMWAIHWINVNGNPKQVAAGVDELFNMPTVDFARLMTFVEPAGLKPRASLNTLSELAYHLQEQRQAHLSKKNLAAALTIGATLSALTINNLRVSKRFESLEVADYNQMFGKSLDYAVILMRQHNLLRLPNPADYVTRIANRMPEGPAQPGLSWSDQLERVSQAMSRELRNSGRSPRVSAMPARKPAQHALGQAA